MSSRWSFATLMITSMMLAGCAGGSGPTWKRADKSLPGNASAGGKGVFSLYEEGGKTAEWSGILGPGDHYGFRRTEDGTVVAYTEPYGDINLTDRSAKSYYWKQESDKSEKNDKDKKKSRNDDM